MATGTGAAAMELFFGGFLDMPVAVKFGKGLYRKWEDVAGSLYEESAQQLLDANIKAEREDAADTCSPRGRHSRAPPNHIFQTNRLIL